MDGIWFVFKPKISLDIKLLNNFPVCQTKLKSQTMIYHPRFSNDTNILLGENYISPHYTLTHHSQERIQSFPPQTFFIISPVSDYFNLLNPFLIYSSDSWDYCDWVWVLSSQFSKVSFKIYTLNCVLYLIIQNMKMKCFERNLLRILLFLLSFQYHTFSPTNTFQNFRPNTKWDCLLGFSKCAFFLFRGFSRYENVTIFRLIHLNFRLYHYLSSVLWKPSWLTKILREIRETKRSANCERPSVW